MPALPAVPDGLTVRHLADDAAAVAELLTAAEPHDDTGENFAAQDITEWWTGWHIDPATDGLGVFDGDGRLAGYATALIEPTWRDAVGIYLEGRVRPELRGRGVGRALLGWQLARGRELHAERLPEAPARLVVPVSEGVAGLEGLVRRAGLEPERWYRQMERPLTGLPRPASVPGVEIVPFDPARDDEVRRTHNACFTEHHGSSERDAETWAALFTGQRSFRPDLSVIGVRDGAVVGYVLAYVYDADSEANGYRQTHLGQIGVLPAARGIGLAKALIAEALRVAADDGCERAGLDVDSDNVTGALRLYESLGFTTARTQVSWSERLAPVAAR
ncbi:UNVERIFIED_ORG: GNAT family N-acetyltransferase [Bacillus sp. AZ43]